MAVYIDPNNPEGGYVDESFVYHTPYGPAMEAGSGMVALDMVYTCSVCERDLEDPEGADLPLCDRCNRTARAHARVEREAREYAESQEGREDRRLSR